MIYNEPFVMQWRLCHCKIENDEIVEVEGFPSEMYNPFDFYDSSEKDVLYRRFISINESNDNEILDFIKSFGFLGINIKSNANFVEDSHNLAEASFDNSCLPFREKLDDIRNEIKLMKLILTVWDSLSFKDVDMIHQHTLTLYNFGIDESQWEYVDEASKSYEHALVFAKYTISNVVNKYISGVCPFLAHNGRRELMKNPTLAFKGHWKAPDLLSAMYCMIYMDFVEGKMIRKCRNETCRDWFEIYGNDDRKIYCSPRCANTQAKRDTRRAKKEREV